MSFAGVTRRTVRRVGLVDLEAVLVDVVAVGMMQVAVVQVVDVVAVLDSDVTAVGAVGVFVVRVLVATHVSCLPRRRVRARPGRARRRVGRRAHRTGVCPHAAWTGAARREGRAVGPRRWAASLRRGPPAR